MKSRLVWVSKITQSNHLTVKEEIVTEEMQPAHCDIVLKQDVGKEALNPRVRFLVSVFCFWRLTKVSMISMLTPVFI